MIRINKMSSAVSLLARPGTPDGPPQFATNGPGTGLPRFRALLGHVGSGLPLVSGRNGTTTKPRM